ADANRPVVQALAIREGRILYAGNLRAALTFRGAGTRVEDYPGRTIIPGMVDAHAHLTGLGTALRTVDLVGTRSYDEVIQRVVERARTARSGEWITGRGWNQNEWADTRFPTHEALSRAVPNNPVYLTRVDGHAALANARAMEAAGVTARTEDPQGGRIIRDGTGAPTGVFVDRAMGLVSRAIPPASDEQLREAITAAIAEANRWGLTGIHDAGVDARTVALYEELARAGRYNLRNYVMLRGDTTMLAAFFRRGPQSALYNGRLWIRAIKISADGALGSRGAALLEDYSDEPGNRGLSLVPPEYIRRVGVLALRNGFQLNVHAIGDRANREVLDAFAAALREVPVADHRFRIEHAQVLHRQDIPRFAELGVIPSMQGSHQSSDAPMAMNRLGWTRAQGAYAWRSLLNTGVVIPNGSDFPVEPVNPLISFHSAVTRQDRNGWPAGGWFPAERMTREEALLSVTLWPAYASFSEDVLGSLSPGKYADFVVLDQDIMTVAPERILETRVLATWLGGTVVYQTGGTR
ncbi:MAG TPA: amidohydrolase, partial [Gemmatimonadales bacterium]|nr:amidohydrolase [Gemmatimonadales bacterium]